MPADMVCCDADLMTASLYGETALVAQLLDDGVEVGARDNEALRCAAAE